MVNRIKEIEKVEEVEKCCVERSEWCNWTWHHNTVSRNLLEDSMIITLSLSVTNIPLFCCKNIQI